MSDKHNNDDPHGYIAFTKGLFLVLVILGALGVAFMLGMAAGGAGL